MIIKMYAAWEFESLKANFLCVGLGGFIDLGLFFFEMGLVSNNYVTFAHNF